MYCRKTPRPGERPDEDLSLRMKGAVCLDCGYVAMMVSVEELRAPIRKPVAAASAATNSAKTTRFPESSASVVVRASSHRPRRLSTGEGASAATEP